jgi:hypothetical protein
MAVTHDAATQGAAFAAVTTQNTVHTPVGVPTGVVVGIVQAGSADEVSGVTYGGLAMTRVRSDARTVTEAGRVYWYALTGLVPAGQQTVAITTTGASAKRPAIFTVAAARPVEIAAHNGADAGIAANPSLSLATPAGVDVACYYAIFSGLAAPVTTVQNNSTHAFGHDFGSSSAMWSRKVATGPTTAGYTAASDDILHAGVALREMPVTPYKGFAVLPVKGYGTAMLDADLWGTGTIGDRLEYVIGTGNRCLVAADVADVARLSKGKLVCTVSEEDTPFSSLPTADQQRVTAAIAELGESDTSGALRDVVQRAGRRVSATFSPDLHLGG